MVDSRSFAWISGQTEGVAFALGFVVVFGFAPKAKSQGPMAAIERMRIESEPKSDSDAVNSFVHNEMLRKSESDPIFEPVDQVVKFCWL